MNLLVKIDVFTQEKLEKSIESQEKSIIIIEDLEKSRENLEITKEDLEKTEENYLQILTFFKAKFFQEPLNSSISLFLTVIFSNFSVKKLEKHKEFLFEILGFFHEGFSKLGSNFLNKNLDFLSKFFVFCENSGIFAKNLEFIEEISKIFTFFEPCLYMQNKDFVQRVFSLEFIHVFRRILGEFFAGISQKFFEESSMIADVFFEEFFTFSQKDQEFIQEKFFEKIVFVYKAAISLISSKKKMKNEWFFEENLGVFEEIPLLSENYKTKRTFLRRFLLQKSFFEPLFTISS